MQEGLTLNRLPVGREEFAPDIPGLNRIDRWFPEGTPGRPDRIDEEHAQVWEMLDLLNKYEGSTLVDLMRHMDKADQNEAFTLLEKVTSKDQLSLDLIKQRLGVIDPETGLRMNEKARFEELWERYYHYEIRNKEEDRKEYVGEQMAELAQFLADPKHLEETKNALSNINHRLEEVIKGRKTDIVGTPNPLKDLPRIEIRNVAAGGAGGPAAAMPYEKATNDWINYITTALGHSDTELQNVHDSTKQILEFLNDYRGGPVTNKTVKAHFERLFEGMWLSYEKSRTKRLALCEAVRKPETRSDRPWVYPDGRELLGYYHDMVADVMQLYERLKVPQTAPVEAGQEPKPEDPMEIEQKIMNILEQMYDLRESMKDQDDKITQFDTVGFLQTVTKGRMLAMALLDAPAETEIWGFTTKIQRSREADRIIGHELEKLVENPNFRPVLDDINVKAAALPLTPVEQRIKKKLDAYFNMVANYVVQPEQVEEPTWTFQELRYAPELGKKRPEVYQDDRFLVINLRDRNFKTLKAIFNGRELLELPDGTIDTYANLRKNKKVIFIESPIATELGGFGGANMEKVEEVMKRDFGGDEDKMIAAWIENRRLPNEGGRPIQEVLNYFPEIVLAKFYVWMKQVQELRKAPHSKKYHAIVYAISHSLDMIPALYHHLTGETKEFAEAVYSFIMDGNRPTTMEDAPFVYDKNWRLKGGKYRSHKFVTRNEKLDTTADEIVDSARRLGLRGT